MSVAGSNPQNSRGLGFARLAAQQHRLRHLHSVAARNIQLKASSYKPNIPPISSDSDSTKPNQSLTTNNVNSSSEECIASLEDDVEPARSAAMLHYDVTHLQMFYTLHEDVTSDAFYTSEKIRGSLNPTWKSINLVEFGDGSFVNTTRQSITVRVWCGHNDSDFKVCIRWDIYLSELDYLGNKISGDQHSPNSLIFGLRDGFYGATSEKESVGKEALPQTLTMEAESSSVRLSYNSRSLLRVQTVIRAIKQTRSHVDHVRREINARLKDVKLVNKKKAQRELAILRVSMLREDLQWRILHQQQLKSSLEAVQLSNSQNELRIRDEAAQLNQDWDALQERKKTYFDVRLDKLTNVGEGVIKTGTMLVSRRRQLLSELAYIYPIQQLPSGDWNIAGVRLPPSEDLADSAVFQFIHILAVLYPRQNETMLAVSLGYTCHLVLMISNCLDLPLRYPMEHRSSRSTIRDHIIDKLAEKDRDFPLFAKGKEKFQFDYGVYILNKNIAQLRNYCGLPTPNLAMTLSNVFSLLYDKLGVTRNRDDAFTNQHLLIPPSFGGAQKSSSAHHHHAVAAAAPSLNIPRLSSSSSESSLLRPRALDKRLTEIVEESRTTAPVNVTSSAASPAASENDVISRSVPLSSTKPRSGSEEAISRASSSNSLLDSKEPTPYEQTMMIAESDVAGTAMKSESRDGDVNDGEFIEPTGEEEGEEYSINDRNGHANARDGNIDSINDDSNLTDNLVREPLLTQRTGGNILDESVFDASGVTEDGTHAAKFNANILQENDARFDGMSGIDASTNRYILGVDSNELYCVSPMSNSPDAATSKEINLETLANRDLDCCIESDIPEHSRVESNDRDSYGATTNGHESSTSDSIGTDVIRRKSVEFPSSGLKSENDVSETNKLSSVDDPSVALTGNDTDINDERRHVSPDEI